MEGSVVRAGQFAGEEILIGGAMVERVTQKTELVDLFAHRTDVIECAAYHVVGIGQVLIAGGIVEALSQQDTVDVRTEKVHALGLENLKQPLSRHGAHRLQTVIAELVHKGLASCLGLLLAAVRAAKRADTATALNNGILDQTFLMLAAPALCPRTVILSGSPPNCAM